MPNLNDMDVAELARSWIAVPSHSAISNRPLVEQMDRDLTAMGFEVQTYLLRGNDPDDPEKLNLIGHSQGALDIRYLTTALGYGDRIASLTSIAGPHRGSPVADVAIGLIDGPAEAILNGLTAAFTGIVYGRPDEFPDLTAALESCSSPARAAYNVTWPDDPEVPIYSYAGLSGLLTRGDEVCDGGDLPAPRRGDILAPEFAVSLAFINQITGPNDGLVAVESARWGHFRGCVRADHLDQVGQLLGVVDSFDFRRFFRDHAQFLADQGH